MPTAFFAEADKQQRLREQEQRRADAARAAREADLRSEGSLLQGQKASVPLRTSFLSPQRALAAALGTVPSVWRCVCGQWVLPSGTANAVPSETDAANVAPFHDGVANATHKDARSDAANAVPGVQDGTANAVCAAVGGTAKTVLPNGNGLAALLMAADH